MHNYIYIYIYMYVHIYICITYTSCVPGARQQVREHKDPGEREEEQPRVVPHEFRGRPGCSSGRRGGGGRQPRRAGRRPQRLLQHGPCGGPRPGRWKIRGRGARGLGYHYCYDCRIITMITSSVYHYW